MKTKFRIISITVGVIIIICRFFVTLSMINSPSIEKIYIATNLIDIINILLLGCVFMLILSYTSIVSADDHLEREAEAKRGKEWDDFIKNSNIKN